MHSSHLWHLLEFGVELEERIQRLHQLTPNLVLTTFDEVQCHARLLSTFQRYFRILQRFDFISWKKTHSVHEREFCHVLILAADTAVWIGGKIREQPQTLGRI